MQVLQYNYNCKAYNNIYQHFHKGLIQVHFFDLVNMSSLKLLHFWELI